MIDRDHGLPLRRQAAVLQLSRSTLYYEPRPVSAAELAIMRRVDELHLDYPFAGSRMMRDLLRGEGVAIGRERVATMMRRMGIEALYRRPNTSKPAAGHRIYPYLLRGLDVVRPNQVWAMDITYIHSNGARLRLSGGRVGLVQPAGALLARLDHNGGRFLLGRSGGGACPARRAVDLQHRPGEPVHQRRFHRLALEECHCDQHGRPWRLARQRICRAALAFGQIRGGVLTSLRQRRRGARLDRLVFGLLQPKAPALEP